MMYRHLQTRFLTKDLLAASVHLLTQYVPFINHLWDYTTLAPVMK